jgi:hypothetical protein
MVIGRADGRLMKIALIALAFIVITNSRREAVFWVSRRVAGACAVYLILRFIASAFSKRGANSE